MSDQGELHCIELVELVTDYLDDALSEKDRVRFEHHLVYCGGCADHLSQVRQTLRTMAELPGTPAPDPLSAALLSAFRAWKRGTVGAG